MDYTTPRIPSPCAAGRGPGSTAIELGWRCNARCDPLHHNPNRNPNLPMDFGSKSKSTIKNFAKCLNSTAVHPDPLPRGDSDRGARAPRPQFGAPSRRTSRAADVTGTIILAQVRRANGEGAVDSARGGRAPHSDRETSSFSRPVQHS